MMLVQNQFQWNCHNQEFNFDDKLQTVLRVLTFEGTKRTGESKMGVAIVLGASHNLQVLYITKLQAPSIVSCRTN